MGVFPAVVAALCAPFALGGFPWKKSLHALFVVSLWPVAAAWDSQLFDEEQNARRLEERKEAVFLSRLVNPVGTFMGSGPIRRPSDPVPKKIILAPWWLSPAIAYRTKEYCVAGSSHQSLPGIVDTAKFYLATDNDEALKILQARKVDYVLSDDPDRIIPSSLTLLGEKTTTRNCMAYRLAEGVNIPDFLKLKHSDKFFKLYRVELPSTPSE